MATTIWKLSERAFVETITVIRDLAAPCERQGRLLVFKQPAQVPPKLPVVAEITDWNGRAERAANLPRARGGVRRTCACAVAAINNAPAPMTKRPKNRGM